MTTISVDEVKNLLLSCQIGDKITLERLDGGGILATMTETKEQIINRKFPELINQPITISDASNKYQVPNMTIRDWVKKGYIKVLSEGYQATINEAEVAYCADIYSRKKQAGIGFRGGPLLDNSGLPYEIKHEGLAKYRRKKRGE